MYSKFKFLVMAFFISATIACQQESKEQAEHEGGHSTEQHTDGHHDHDHESVTAHAARGLVVSVSEADAEGKVRVTIDHEAVPDFMDAMKMTFTANAADLKEVVAGDKISFEMMRGDSGFMIRSVSKLPAETELKLGGM